MNKIPQIVVRIIFIIGIVLCILMIFSFIIYKNKIPGVLKYKPLIVETNTSISNVKKGDLIIIKDIDINKYKKGDVIVFRENKNINILSKIESIDNTKFILSRDIKVDKKVMQGIKILRIPLLGYLVMFLQSNIGKIVFVVLLMLSIVCYKSRTRTLK